jgi:GAF domain-containing protein
LVAPIEGRSGVLGAVAFGYAQSGRQYKAADLSIAARVARQIARAVDHARLPQSPPAAVATARRLRSAPARPQRPMKPSTGSSGERARLLNELAREERMLTRMLERYMAEYPPPASRASRLRARS